MTRAATDLAVVTHLAERRARRGSAALCPPWCRYHHAPTHPCDESWDESGLIDHVREFPVAITDARPVAVEVLATDRRASPSARPEPLTGPGVSLTGLVDVANAGHLLTANDARVLAEALAAAAELLDAIALDPDAYI